MTGITEPIPHGSVIITPTKMYEEMQEIARKVDHVATILDPSLAQIREDISANKQLIAVIKAERETAVNALDLRIRSLENWRWFVLGVASLFAPGAGFVLSLLFGGS